MICYTKSIAPEWMKFTSVPDLQKRDCNIYHSAESRSLLQEPQVEESSCYLLGILAAMKQYLGYSHLWIELPCMSFESNLRTLVYYKPHSNSRGYYWPYLGFIKIFANRRHHNGWKAAFVHSLMHFQQKCVWRCFH